MPNVNMGDKVINKDSGKRFLVVHAEPGHIAAVEWGLGCPLPNTRLIYLRPEKWTLENGEELHA